MTDRSEPKPPPDLVSGGVTVPGSERTRCEVYSRVMGYLRPVSYFNAGKQSEYRERVTFTEDRAHERMEV